MGRWGIGGWLVQRGRERRREAIPEEQAREITQPEGGRPDQGWSRLKWLHATCEWAMFFVCVVRLEVAMSTALQTHVSRGTRLSLKRGAGPCAAAGRGQSSAFKRPPPSSLLHIAQQAFQTANGTACAASNYNPRKETRFGRPPTPPGPAG